MKNLESKIKYALLYLLIEIILLTGVQILSPTNLAGPGFDVLFFLAYVVVTPYLFFLTLIKAFKAKNFWLPLIYLAALVTIVCGNLFASVLREIGAPIHRLK